MKPDWLRHQVLRFALWLAEYAAPPNPMRDLMNTPIADWERPYLDAQAKELNRILL